MLPRKLSAAKPSGSTPEHSNNESTRDPAGTLQDAANQLLRIDTDVFPHLRDLINAKRARRLGPRETFAFIKAVEAALARILSSLDDLTQCPEKRESCSSSKTVGTSAESRTSTTAANMAAELSSARMEEAIRTFLGLLQQHGFDVGKRIFSPNLPHPGDLLSSLTRFDSALRAQMCMVSSTSGVWSSYSVTQLLNRHFASHPDTLDSTMPWGESMLSTCALTIPTQKHSLDVLKLLLNLGCNPNTIDSSPYHAGKSPLHHLRDLYFWLEPSSSALKAQKQGKRRKFSDVFRGLAATPTEALKKTVRKAFRELLKWHADPFVGDSSGENCIEAHDAIKKDSDITTEAWNWYFLGARDGKRLWSPLSTIQRKTLTNYVEKMVTNTGVPEWQGRFSLWDLSFRSFSSVSSGPQSASDEASQVGGGAQGDANMQAPTEATWYLCCETLPHECFRFSPSHKWVWEYLYNDAWTKFPSEFCQTVDSASRLCCASDTSEDVEAVRNVSAGRSSALHEPRPGKPPRSAGSQQLSEDGVEDDGELAQAMDKVALHPNSAEAAHQLPQGMEYCLVDLETFTASFVGNEQEVGFDTFIRWRLARQNRLGFTDADEEAVAATATAAATGTGTGTGKGTQEDEDVAAEGLEAPLALDENVMFQTMRRPRVSSDAEEIGRRAPENQEEDGHEDESEVVTGSKEEEEGGGEEEEVTSASASDSTSVVRNLNDGPDVCRIAKSTKVIVPVRTIAKHHVDIATNDLPRKANEILSELRRGESTSKDRKPATSFWDKKAESYVLDMGPITGEEKQAVEDYLHGLRRLCDEIKRGAKLIRRALHSLASFLKKSVTLTLYHAESMENERVSEEMKPLRRAVIIEWDAVLQKVVKSTLLQDLGTHVENATETALTKYFTETQVKVADNGKLQVTLREGLEPNAHNILGSEQPRPEEYLAKLVNHLTPKDQSSDSSCLRDVVWQALGTYLPAYDFKSLKVPAEYRSVNEEHCLRLNEACVNVLHKHVQHFCESKAEYFISKARHFDRVKQEDVLRDDKGDVPELDRALKGLAIHFQARKVCLPLYLKSEGLLDMIRSSDVVTLKCSTGSGKSTLLPPLLLAEGYEHIIVTQPRRLPCTKIAQRVGDTFGKHLVGWCVSGNGANYDSRLMVMTDGYLKAQIAPRALESNELADGIMDTTEVIMVDEAHERSLNIDLCLAFLAQEIASRKRKGSKYPKVVVASATLSEEEILRPFITASESCGAQGGLLIDRFNVEVRSPNPVEVKFEPKRNAVEVAHTLWKEAPTKNRILCFVPSTYEVRRAKKVFDQKTGTTTASEVLFASQSSQVQNSALRSEASVFFATNIAETSLTFTGLTHVVDSGMVNQSLFRPRLGRNELVTGRISRSHALQRKGRVGRTCDGVYIGLYNGMESLPSEFPEPMILACDVTDEEFNLRLRQSSMQKMGSEGWLPTQVPSETLEFALYRLRCLGLLTPTTAGTDVGPAPLRLPPADLAKFVAEEVKADPEVTSAGSVLALLPSVGSVEMLVSLYSGMFEHGCGDDILKVAAIVMSLPNNTDSILGPLTNFPDRDSGDVATLLAVFGEVCDSRQSRPQRGPPQRSDPNMQAIEIVCTRHGLQSEPLALFLGRALQRYLGSRDFFVKRQRNISRSLFEAAFKKAPTRKVRTLVMRALVRGHFRNIFHCTSQHAGRANRYKQVFGQVLLKAPGSNIDSVLEVEGGLGRGCALAKRPSEVHDEWVLALQVLLNSTQTSGSRSLEEVAQADSSEETIVIQSTIRLADRIELNPTMETIIGKGCRHVQLVEAEESKLLGGDWSSFDLQQFLNGQSRSPYPLSRSATDLWPLLEEYRLHDGSTYDDNSRILSLRGPSIVSAVELESKLMQEVLCEQLELNVLDAGGTNADDVHMRTFEQNVKEAFSAGRGRLFYPLVNRWKNEHQVSLKINSSSKSFTLTGKIKPLLEAFDMFRGFARQLADAGKLNNREYDFGNEWIDDNERETAPTSLISDDEAVRNEILGRIKNVTDRDREQDDVSFWEAVYGDKVSRGTRMEVAAWVAVTKFNCRLEGGFVRDWIVGGRENTIASSALVSHPGAPRGGFEGRPIISDELIPSDLDLQLPLNLRTGWFDREEYVKECRRFGLQVDLVHEDGLLDVILFDTDKETGPFTAEFIAPTSAITHDRLDFDVNNLCCIAGYTQALGQRIAIQKGDSTVTVKDIVERIREKQLRVTRDANPKVLQRLEKMKTKRGWEHVDEDINYLPRKRNTPCAIFMKVSKGDSKLVEIEHALNSIAGATLKHANYVSNYILGQIFEYHVAHMKHRGDDNRKLLYHGTSKEAAQNICHNGFDKREWRQGMFGAGAYFTHSVEKAHGFAVGMAEEAGNGKRQCCLLLCDVAVGRPEVVDKNSFSTQADENASKERRAPARGYDCILGKNHGGMSGVMADEYVIFDQAQISVYIFAQYEV